MMATSTKFCAARKRARLFAIACDYPDQQGSMQPTVPIPDLAAHLRGLRNSSKTRRRLRWPPLRSFASRGSLFDRDATATATDLPMTPHTLRRPARLLAPLHTPESCAICALKPLQTHSILSTLSSLGHFAHFAHFDVPLSFPRFPQGDHLREVSRPAEACATISDHPDQQSSKQPTVPIPDLAAPGYGTQPGRAIKQQQNGCRAATAAPSSFRSWALALANAGIDAADGTSCMVMEVASYYTSDESLGPDVLVASSREFALNVDVRTRGQLLGALGNTGSVELLGLTLAGTSYE
ncbi:hypothetical protein EDB86DRAFT_3103670 [Lactarius hatsudake]|nr:hypothetical protein EDB86DRAFT_3103670 [Lactarius hatsudake]